MIFKFNGGVNTMKLKFSYKCGSEYYVDTENKDVLNKVTRKLKNNKKYELKFKSFILIRYFILVFILFFK